MKAFNFRNRSPWWGTPLRSQAIRRRCPLQMTFALFSHFNRLTTPLSMSALPNATQAPAARADEAGSAAAAWLRARRRCPGPSGKQPSRTHHYKICLITSCQTFRQCKSLFDFLRIPFFLGHLGAKPFFTYFSLKLKRSLIYHSMRSWSKIITAQILVVQVHIQQLSN